MARGGARSGTPGRSYPNRSDMRGPLPARVATGQTYGAAGAQAASQRSVPMAPASAPPVGAPPVAGGPGPPPPGALGPLTRPTERPGEPVTSGLPTGAGPGPEALGMGVDDTPEVAELRAIYSMFPNQDLLELLEDYDHGIRF